MAILLVLALAVTSAMSGVLRVESASSDSFQARFHLQRLASAQWRGDALQDVLDATGWQVEGLEAQDDAPPSWALVGPGGSARSHLFRFDYPASRQEK